MLLSAVAVGLLLFQTQRHFEELSREAAEALRTDPAKAADLYRQCVQAKPDWAEGWFYLGVTRFQLSQFSPSVEALQKAAALDPKHGTVWAFLGLAEERLGKAQNALTDIEKGEQLGLADDPAFIATVRQTAARLSLAANDPTSAVAQLQPLTQSGDHSPATVELLGESVLNTDTNNKEAVALAGETAWQLYSGHPEDALRLSSELAEKYGTVPGVHYLRGICLLRTDPAAAKHEFETELKLSPKSAVARLQIAILDLRAHQPVNAEALAAQACQLEPRNPLAHLVLGRALLDQNKPAAAIPAFQKAVELDRANAQAHFFLARAYHAIGREADTAREKALYEKLNRGSQGTLQ